MSMISQIAASGVRFSGGPSAPYRPKVLVRELGFAREIDTDINGDGTPDLSHGEVIKRIILSQCPEAKVVFRFARRNLLFKTPRRDKIFFQVIAEMLQERAEKLFDAINLSYGTLKEYAACNLQPPVTPNTLAQRRDEILEQLDEESFKSVPYLEEIARQGVPVYISSGNEANQEFLTYTLARGCHIVGATDAKGNKASYSNDNTMVNRWAQGTFAITKVKGGYDITGDGKAEVFDDEVSEGTPIVMQFVGKPLADVLATEKELAELVRDQVSGPFLYKLTDLVARDQISEIGAKTCESMGEYVAYFANSRTFLPGFSVDADGRVVFDPDHSGRPNAVNVLRGTSFATPLALGRDLHQKFCNQRPDRSA